MRHYDNWLKGFVEYASFGEAPLAMYFWVGVSVIAGALRRQVWVEQGYFQWLPNFYVILVAPPGVVAKSTTASIGMNLLRQVKEVKFGPDVVTWQALTQSLGQATELVQMPNGDFMPMSAITIESSEFGNFLNPHDREMVDVLVSLWDGKRGTFVKVTKTQGSDTIENPCFNIIACTTPAWISGNFPEYMIGGGFTSRCVFVYAEEKRQLIAYPGLALPPEFMVMQERLINDLQHIAGLKGMYVLDGPAVEWGIEWYEQHNKNRPPHLDNARFGGYIARKQTHVHKLAMVLAAAQRDELSIIRQDLISANEMVSALEHEMPKVFAHIGQTPEAQHSERLIDAVVKRGQVEYEALFREVYRDFPTAKAFDDALGGAVKAGFVTIQRDGNRLIIRVANEPS